MQQLSYCSWSAFEFEWYRNGKKIRNLTSYVKYIFLNIRNLKCLLLGLHVPHEHTSKMLKSKGRYIEVINGFRMNFENNRKQYFDVDKNIKGGIVWSLAFDSNYIFTTTKILCTPCICLSYTHHTTIHIRDIFWNNNTRCITTKNGSLFKVRYADYMLLKINILNLYFNRYM